MADFIYGEIEKLKEENKKLREVVELLNPALLENYFRGQLSWHDRDEIQCKEDGEIHFNIKLARAVLKELDNE